MDSSNNNNNNMSVNDSPSVYLSFDADSTSSSVFKTLDTSNMMSQNGSSPGEGKDSNAFQLSQLKTVKKVDVAVTAKLSPLVTSSFPKNVLHGYNAICSTPAKVQFLRTVETQRGSEINGAPDFIDLGLAFMRMDDDDKPKAAAVSTQLTDTEENKENEEGSTLCVSSSVDLVTSFLENKMHIISECQAEVTEIAKIEIEEQKVAAPKATQQTVETVDLTVDEVEPFINSAQKGEAGNMISKVQDKKQQDSMKPKFQGHLKTHIPARKSVCLPDLKANRPSRIKTSLTKTRSPLMGAGTSSLTTDLPKMANKLRDITKEAAAKASVIPTTVSILNVAADAGKSVVNASKTIIDAPMASAGAVKKVAFGNAASTDSKGKTYSSSADIPRKSIASIMKGRTSMLPTATSGDKRPSSYMKRMSCVLKTTLNSPARKIARRSVYMPMNLQQTRRSVMPSLGSVAASRRSVLPSAGGGGGASRKSVLPTATAASQTNTSKVPTIPKDDITPASRTKQRYTLLASHNSAPAVIPVKAAFSTNGNLSKKKLESSFTCAVCAAKFSIKSLFDAHKRSHEGDGPPAFCKKPSTASAATVAADSNKCQFCDKKFALVRALHIHLLQNCAKIPPQEKRKLQFTEMDHVEKAHLPTFSNSNVNDSNTGKKLQKSSSTASSLDSFGERARDVLFTLTDSQMAPPASTKVKKRVAHAGIYRTPSKSVPCNECKLSFKSVLDYTNHSLSVHSTSIRGGENLSEISDSSTISNASNASNTVDEKPQQMD